MNGKGKCSRTRVRERASVLGGNSHPDLLKRNEKGFLSIVEREKPEV